MRTRYLLKHVVQAIIFAILLMFVSDKKTYVAFFLYAGVFLVINLGLDFVYGLFVDRKIKKELKELKELEKKEP